MVLSTFLAGPELNHVMADMVHYSVAASEAEILFRVFFTNLSMFKMLASWRTRSWTCGQEADSSVLIEQVWKSCQVQKYEHFYKANTKTKVLNEWHNANTLKIQCEIWKLKAHQFGNNCCPIVWIDQSFVKNHKRALSIGKCQSVYFDFDWSSIPNSFISLTTSCHIGTHWKCNDNL